MATLSQENERLKRERERLVHDLKTGQNNSTEEAVNRRVRQKLNDVRTEYNVVFKQIDERYPNAAKIIGECKDAFRSAMGKLVQEFAE